MAELSLREQIAHELWYKNTRSKYQWEYLISTRKKAWYTKADSIIKLMLAKVDKIEKEKAGTGITSMSYAGGFNDALEMVKSLLEGK